MRDSDIIRPEPDFHMPATHRKAFSGKIFDIFQWDQELYDGSYAVFERAKRPDTVVVIPVTTDGKILITEQEQPGKKPFLGFAGGRVDEGEGIVTAAERELLEETGYKPDKLTLLEAIQPESKIDWAIFTFVAHGCAKIQEQNLDAGEKITVREIDFDEFIERSRRNDFRELSVYIRVLEALLDPAKMQQLRTALLG